MTETLVQPDSNVTPAEIRRAVSVLWFSLLLAVIATIIDWRRVYHEDATFAVFVQVIGWGFLALLIWKISQGRNWARITWIVVFIAGCAVILAFALFSKTYRAGVFGSPFSTVVVVVQAAIQFYATVLLLTSQGRTWFRQKQ